MKIVRRLALTVVIAALLSAVAFGTGWALRPSDEPNREDRPAAAGSTIEPEETPERRDAAPTRRPTEPQDEEPGSSLAGASRARRRERRGQGPAGPAQADRLVRGRRHRLLRRGDHRGGARLPGQARDPGDRRGRPADAEPAARHDHRAHPGRADQPAGRQRARRARPAVHDRPRAVRRQVQPHPALGRRRRRCRRRSTSGSARSTRRPARARSASRTRAATTSRASTTRSMPFAMFFSGGQAVHYSPDFAAVGYAGASHGCVERPRLRRHRVAVRPGAGRRQGDRLLVLSQDSEDLDAPRRPTSPDPKISRVRSPSPSWHWTAAGSTESSTGWPSGTTCCQ